jgi:hypothetical protein
MTNYALKPRATLPSLAWQEKKEKRKELLEQMRARRRERYRQLIQLFLITYMGLSPILSVPACFLSFISALSQVHFRQTCYP